MAHRIAGFEVFEKMSEGGLGVVYKAEDSQLCRDVALKSLFEKRTDDGYQRAMLDIAALNHANLVKLHDVVEHEERPVLVMEYVKGQDLRYILDQRRLTMDEVLHHAIGIADGLAAVHSASTVHRNLKPVHSGLCD